MSSTETKVRELGVVVGASGGIGGACVHALAGAGPEVLATSRREQKDTDRNWFQLDVCDEASRKRFIDEIRERDLPLRYLVIASGVPHRANISGNTAADWERVLWANLIGPSMLITELTRDAKWSKRSSIVVIGSLSGRRALPLRSLYGTSKAALEHFCRTAAVELAPAGISVNVVSVGVTETPFLDGGRASLSSYIAERIPIGRVGRPEEIAQVVRDVILGPEFLTAAVLDLDGGSGALG